MRFSFLHLFFALGLALLVIIGCFRESSVSQEMRSRIEQKAEIAKTLIRNRAQSGEDVSGVVNALSE